VFSVKEIYQIILIFRYKNAGVIQGSLNFLRALLYRLMERPR